VAIAHDADPAFGRLPATMSLEVFFDFLLDGGLKHFAGAFANELFQGTFGVKFCWPLQREDLMFVHGASFLC
jgi:hypothetical protein